MKLRFIAFLLAFFVPAIVGIALVQAQMTTAGYISKYNKLAITEMKRSGVPASITLAQGILESGSGNSYLATEGKNHFGIKCHDTWKGKRVYADDDAPGECFRKYRSVYESYVDHSDFLLQNSRYAFLFDLPPTDYKAWARGLKAAGYATDPKYPQKLIDLIERYDLNRLDLPGGVDCDNIAITQPHVFYLNRIKTVIFNCDIDVKDVAKAYGKSANKLAKYNDLKSMTIAANTNVFLQPKRCKGPFGTRKHQVKPGETMAQISQTYGVKLSKLYKRNKLRKGQEPATAEIIYLRGKRKSSPKTTAYHPPTNKPGGNTGTPDGGKTGYYTVKAGDTLYSIARTYGISVAQLKSLNKLTSDALSVGQKLKVKR